MLLKDGKLSIFGWTLVRTEEYNMIEKALDCYGNMGPEDLRQFADDLENDMKNEN